MEIQEFTSSQKELMSVDFILLFIRRRFPSFQIKSVTPWSFTVGSNNHAEDLPSVYELPNKSIFYGKLFLSINPNSNPLASEQIKIKYRSYFNDKPFFKHITRQVEMENIINENSFSDELFDQLSIEQQSNKYDVYFTFVGFKIDYN